MRLLDPRHTARLLARSPAFTLSAVLCLGLGIGVTSSLFTIFNTLLWKPLPVADPGALVRVFAQGPARARVYRNFSYPEYLDYRQENRALSDLVAPCGVQAVWRRAGDEASRVFGEAVFCGGLRSVAGDASRRARLENPQWSRPSARHI